MFKWLRRLFVRTFEFDATFVQRYRDSLNDLARARSQALADAVRKERTDG